MSTVSADLYGLGVVLYEALTGQRPFESPRKGSSVMEALLRRPTSDAEPSQACETAIPKSPRARSRHPPLFRIRSPTNAINPQASSPPISRPSPTICRFNTPHEPWRSKTWGWLRRKRRSLAMAAGILLAATVVGVYWLSSLLGTSETFDLVY